MISRYKPFGNLLLMTKGAESGLVHLDVCWIDQPTSLTRWTVANVALLSVTHLGGHAHLRRVKGLISKTSLTANHAAPGGPSWPLHTFTFPFFVSDFAT